MNLSNTSRTSKTQTFNVFGNPSHSNFMPLLSPHPVCFTQPYLKSAASELALSSKAEDIAGNKGSLTSVMWISQKFQSTD